MIVFSRLLGALVALRLPYEGGASRSSSYLSTLSSVEGEASSAEGVETAAVLTADGEAVSSQDLSLTSLDLVSEDLQDGSLTQLGATHKGFIDVDFNPRRRAARRRAPPPPPPPDVLGDAKFLGKDKSRIVGKWAKTWATRYKGRYIRARDGHEIE